MIELIIWIVSGTVLLSIFLYIVGLYFAVKIDEMTDQIINAIRKDQGLIWNQMPAKGEDKEEGL